MQIICKVKEGCLDDAAKLVTASIREVLPLAIADQVTVEQVFPGLITGQRARLFTVTLPELSGQKIAAVMESLRGGTLEYVELSTEKQPM